MCVIIVKPAGVRMPSRAVLEAAAHCNPHGFGYVVPGRRYRTLDAEKFLSSLESIDDNEPCIMHFRLATHGSKRVRNCHPFKIGNVYMAHNGIFNVVPTDDMTDSEEAFRTFVYPAIAKYGWRSEAVRETAEYLNMGYSKIALMRGDDIATYGHFYRRYDDDCLYSNLRFEASMRPLWHSL